MNSSHSPAFRKCCAAIMAASLVLQPLGAYAAAITTSVLAETPLQGFNPVKPNIMFTVDDSGSMDFEFLPDFTALGPPPYPSGITYCRDNRYCGGIPAGNIFGGPWNILDADPPIRSSAMNRIFYDPTANYFPGKTATSAPLACEGSNTTCSGPWTAVYVNGFAGYPATNNGGSINLAPASPNNTGVGYPDTAWCNNQANTAVWADLATAWTDGSKCRLNGRAYSAFSSGTGGWTAPAIAAGYNYPNAINVATGSATACASSEFCVYNIRANVFANPYYYTTSSVQYCQNRDTTGFGLPPCGTRWDETTFKYVRYGTDTTKSFDPLAFTRVDILPATLTYPSGRTYAQEMANFAKWYSFYRSRMLAIKTAGGIAFSALNEDTARVGFHTINAFASKFQDVKAFTPANKSTWFDTFYSIASAGGTPLPSATWRIGEYFAGNGAAAGLPTTVDPLDPATGQCQPNYHFMTTDGYWNQPLSPGSVGDQDNIVPSLPAPVAGFTTGNPFPPPYREASTASSNSLADLAMYYWIRDLRPALPDLVVDSVAPWQHVTMYGLSIGAQGNIVWPAGIDPIKAGTTPWPVPTGAERPDSIDDLWHAAINSRGQFFSADNAQKLAEGIVSSLSAFSDSPGTGAAVGIAGAQFSVTKSFGYRTSYEAGWWGDVKKYALDPNTGALPVDAQGVPVNAPVWSAATALDTQSAATGWDTNRRIITINDASNTVVPFRVNNLSSAQQSSLVAGWQVVPVPPSAQSVVNYLRGDPSNEGVDTASFRVRSHILGDIVYSGAVPVGAPNQPYTDAGNPGYTAFATAQKNRTPTVYVGGNDGMLHAFNDSAVVADAGKETWAYIPKALFNIGNPNATDHLATPDFQLGALSYRRGGIPLFEHKFYVNATPRIWDVDFANTNTRTPPQSGNDWHTILVGGLGAGGRAVYALDVTTPVNLTTDTEASVASSGRVLWEFTDANLGYVFDPPTLVKTKRYGWVALVASGYNNPGGEGILYVLNPTNGVLLKKISTGIGSDGDPSGLSTIRAFDPNRKDPYMLQAYGGDLKGNVWRFDLSDPNESNWKVELVAKLTDPSGKAQPVTTGVYIAVDQNQNPDHTYNRYLFVGTGKLLGPGDIADTSVVNTLYVIRDGTDLAPDPAPATPYSRSDLNAVTGSSVSGFVGTPKKGWYQDAADPSWKIGTDVHAEVQTVVFAFSRPSSDPCAPPLSSTLFARDLNTGASVLQDPGGNVVSNIDIGAGIAGVSLIQGAGGASASAWSDVRVLVTTMKGGVLAFGVKLPAAGLDLKHRVSWRLLNRD